MKYYETKNKELQNYLHKEIEIKQQKKMAMMLRMNDARVATFAKDPIRKRALEDK